jgi:hypothetical protein
MINVKDSLAYPEEKLKKNEVTNVQRKLHNEYLRLRFS